MTVRIKCIRDVLVGVAAFLYTAYNRGLINAQNAQDTFGILSDCFVISGIILVSVEFFSYAARLGAFDMLTYSASNLLLAHKHEYEDFYTYKCRRASTRVHYHSAIWLGIGSLALGGLFLIGYMLV